MKIEHERDLDQIAPKEPSSYDGVSLPALVVYSLYWLHEWELRRTIEAITVLSWRLFPTKFSMVGWPQYPDFARVNRSLMQGGPKYRNWLTGAAVKGFSLNQRGIQMALDIAEKIGVPTTTDGKVVTEVVDRTPLVNAGRARTIEPEREVAKVRESRLFEKWKEGVLSERDLIHVHTLLDIFEHTPGQVREKRMKDLERSADDSGDQEIMSFLSDVRANFSAVFNPNKQQRIIIWEQLLKKY